MATVMARTTWRARVGRRVNCLGGVDVSADGAVGIIGGDDPKGHHSRWWLVVSYWLLVESHNGAGEMCHTGLDGIDQFIPGEGVAQCALYFGVAARWQVADPFD